MAVLYKLFPFARKCGVLREHFGPRAAEKSRSLCTIIQQQPQQKSRSILKYSLIGGSVGALVGIGYSYKIVEEKRKNISLEGTEIETKPLKYKPPVPVSRKVISPVDTTGLKLTLFQYQTCPFCCKVRVFLDYFGISYDVVEVDPVLRNEISWSSYKKVPILLTKIKNGYQPLNDSSMIISLIASYLQDTNNKIENLSTYYPNIALHDENGNFKHEVVNKYFLMYQNNIPKDRLMNDIVEERKWRQWADEVLVHVLSPNVYRSMGEAYETFNWFSDVGKWEEYFPTWERSIMVNVGALAMWMISKRLKKRHHLKDDVRESLYDEINYWLSGINARGSTFMGGQNPDLSDLAVYGILKSIEGCAAFKDALENTKLGTWYNAMSEKVDAHAGSQLIAS